MANRLQVIVVKQRLQQLAVQGIVHVQRAVCSTGLCILRVQWAQVMGTAAQGRKGDVFLLDLKSRITALSILLETIARSCRQQHKPFPPDNDTK